MDPIEIQPAATGPEKLPRCVVEELWATLLGDKLSPQGLRPVFIREQGSVLPGLEVTYLLL
jgi:hypothetical protein